MKRALILASALVVSCKQGDAPSAESAPSQVALAVPSASAPLAASSAGASPTATAPAATASGSPEPAVGSQGSWSFDADKVGAPPAGFRFGRTGEGREGRWGVVAVPDAPSKPNVLAQLDPDTTDYRFPVAFVEGSSFKDVRLSVSCKPVAGHVDQGCGLVWRLTDADNYYLTRANALEDNVNLYHVKNGRRITFASWNGKVSSMEWHKLRVEARGDRFQVYFDEKKILDAKDSTFGNAGKIGVWTKADSIMQFDDLSATPL